MKDHLEAVVELHNIINPQIINKLTSFIDYKAKKFLDIERGIDKDVRNVRGYQLGFKTPSEMFYWNYIKKEIERLYGLYIIKFPLLKSYKINQIDLLKYGMGGKYEVHIDHHGNLQLSRTLSVIMNLNDEYEGGDLIFTDQKEKEIKRIKLGKGSIVFFPSNFMYPHSIQPITKGKRYSIVAWLQ